MQHLLHQHVEVGVILGSASIFRILSLLGQVCFQVRSKGALCCSDRSDLLLTVRADRVEPLAQALSSTCARRYPAKACHELFGLRRSWESFTVVKRPHWWISWSLLCAVVGKVQGLSVLRGLFELLQPYVPRLAIPSSNGVTLVAGEHEGVVSLRWFFRHACRRLRDYYSRLRPGRNLVVADAERCLC